MGAPKKARKSPARTRKKGKKGAKRRFGVVLAVMVPLVAVGAFLAYHSDSRFKDRVDEHVSDMRQWMASIGGNNASEKAQTASKQTSPTPQNAAPKGPTGDFELPTLPDLPDSPQLDPLPRQVREPAVSRDVSVEVHAAQKMATALFGGSITASRAEPRAFWYRFEMKGTHATAPFPIQPGNVDISTVSHTGPFLKGVKGFVVFVRATDPGAPEGQGTYVGAALFAGTPENPGKVLRQTAMQASDGTITRHQTLDVQGDSILELVIEVESAATGGYQFRDLAVVDFGPSGTRFLWTARTLDDGPGALVDKAQFKRVEFVDTNADGRVEIQVERGKRTFRINKDFTRTLLKEESVSKRTYELAGSRFKVVAK